MLLYLYNHCQSGHISTYRGELNIVVPILITPDLQPV